MDNTPAVFEAEFSIKFFYLWDSCFGNFCRFMSNVLFDLCRSVTLLLAVTLEKSFFLYLCIPVHNIVVTTTVTLAKFLLLKKNDITPGTIIS